MTPERWQRVKNVLQEALEVPPERRSAFLDQACSGDQVLRQEVESLLSCSDEARTSFLRSSVRITTLPKGTKLGEYEVQTLLGSGGMGQVYRARDLRLGRNVAIKVLPSFLSSDPDRLRRFEQEARAAAALNHPNILAVFHMGTYEGMPYMVTELLEGETVREETKRGPMPQSKALAHAIQIAHGLAAAHDKGVVHRDLKPENLFVTKDGRIKILDFGLARLVQRLTSSPSTEDSASPVPHGRRVSEGVDADAATASIDPEALTKPGVVMGTVGYTSPEQVRGEKADHRADIFSFGAILYEMLSAKRAFEGQTSVDIMSAILNEEPPGLSQTAPNTPPALQRIVSRCLEKRPERRFQSASDLAFALEAMPEAAPAPAASAPRRLALPWVLAALSLLLGTALVGAIIWLRVSTSPTGLQSPVRFSIAFAGDETLGEYLGSSVAFSPDGRRVAYVANRGAERSIYIRALDALESVEVAGTERGGTPFFSPDGEWLGFVGDGKLKKVPLIGGTPQALADLVVAEGANWGPDDTIVYSPNPTVGLFAVPARGGTPRRLTAPDSSHGELGHIWPEVLPGGREVLFTIWTGENIDQWRIAILSLDTGKWRVVFEGGWSAQYAPGYLLYMRSSTLLAVPFDWKLLRVRGQPVPVVEGVWRNLDLWVAYFAVSQTGSLVYVPGKGQDPQRSLVWVDRSGRRGNITSTRKPFAAPRLSPDGQRLALYLASDVTDIWIYHLARDALTRLTFGPDNHTVAWSPDGKRVAFESSRSGIHHLYVQSADGTGSPTQITAGQYDHYVCDWSPDGRELVYVEHRPEGGAKLWVVNLDGKPQPRPFLQTPFNEKQATFSPSGHWIAYTSDESGQNEVYVRPFPGPGAKQQISSGGGEEPAWARSGRELFYRLGGRMMAVSVRENGEFTVDRPKLLFEGLFSYNYLFCRSYDVAPDGRFIMVAEPEPQYTARQINIVLDWPAQLSQPRQ